MRCRVDYCRSGAAATVNYATDTASGRQCGLKPRAHPRLRPCRCARRKHREQLALLRCRGQLTHWLAGNATSHWQRGPGCLIKEAATQRQPLAVGEGVFGGGSGERSHGKVPCVMRLLRKISHVRGMQNHPGCRTTEPHRARRASIVPCPTVPRFSGGRLCRPRPRRTSRPPPQSHPPYQRAGYPLGRPRGTRPQLDIRGVDTACAQFVMPQPGPGASAAILTRVKIFCAGPNLSYRISCISSLPLKAVAGHLFLKNTTAEGPPAARHGVTPKRGIGPQPSTQSGLRSSKNAAIPSAPSALSQHRTKASTDCATSASPVCASTRRHQCLGFGHGPRCGRQIGRDLCLNGCVQEFRCDHPCQQIE